MGNNPSSNNYNYNHDNDGGGTDLGSRRKDDDVNVTSTSLREPSSSSQKRSLGCDNDVSETVAVLQYSSLLCSKTYYNNLITYMVTGERSNNNSSSHNDNSHTNTTTFTEHEVCGDMTVLPAAMTTVQALLNVVPQHCEYIASCDIVANPSSCLFVTSTKYVLLHGRINDEDDDKDDTHISSPTKVRLVPYQESFAQLLYDECQRTSTNMSLISQSCVDNFCHHTYRPSSSDGSRISQPWAILQVFVSAFVQKYYVHRSHVQTYLVKTKMDDHRQLNLETFLVQNYDNFPRTLMLWSQDNDDEDLHKMSSPMTNMIRNLMTMPLVPSPTNLSPLPLSVLPQQPNQENNEWEQQQQEDDDLDVNAMAAWLQTTDLLKDEDDKTSNDSKDGPSSPDILTRLAGFIFPVHDNDNNVDDHMGALYRPLSPILANDGNTTLFDLDDNFVE
jgi:hypothetical protein